MKKLLSFLFASLVIIACSDENPSSVFENTGKQQDLDDQASYTESYRYFDFLDKAHLRNGGS